MDGHGVPMFDLHGVAMNRRRAWRTAGRCALPRSVGLSAYMVRPVAWWWRRADGVPWIDARRVLSRSVCLPVGVPFDLHGVTVAQGVPVFR